MGGDNRQMYWVIFHELTHYYADTTDDYYIDDDFFYDNQWLDDSNDVEYDATSKDETWFDSQAKWLTKNADHLAGFFARYYY